MTVFDAYARYYDLLYRDKDYRGEVDFVCSLLHRYAPTAGRILELGCGTGKHAEHLCRSGYRVQGVDQSTAMLAAARERWAGLEPEHRRLLAFGEGDVRNLRLAETFDVVLSLFHVVSYQTENADLEAAFATAAAHLAPGGLFLFDFWYGPAVLSEMPEVRVKRLADTDIQVTRIAEPTLHPEENCVTVNYEVSVLHKADGTYSRFAESHRMRYLFLPEICFLLKRHGMEPVFSCEWMTGKAPDLDTWSVCTGARVRN